MNKTSFFTKLKNNLYNVKTFSKYVKEGFGSAVKYGICLFLILSVVQGVSTGYKTYNETNRSIKFLEESKEDFNIKDGILKLSNSPQVFEKNGLNMVVDSNVDLNNSSKLEGKYLNNGSIVLALKDGVKIQGGGLSQSFYYKDLFPNGLTKVDIINQLKYTGKIMIGLMIIFTTVLNAFDLILNIILISFIGMGISYMLRMKVKFKNMVALVIYAITLPILLMTGLNLVFGNLYNTTPVVMATITFLFFILRYIKIELINRNN